MENIDIIILTSVVVISFVIFIVTSFKEVTRMEEEPYEFEKATGFSRAALFNVLKDLLEDGDSTEVEKERIRSTLKRTISDMHMDGVYFDKNKKLQNKGSTKTWSEDNKGKS